MKGLEEKFVVSGRLSRETAERISRADFYIFGKGGRREALNGSRVLSEIDELRIVENRINIYLEGPYSTEEEAVMEEALREGRRWEGGTD